MVLKKLCAVPDAIPREEVLGVGDGGRYSGRNGDSSAALLRALRR